ncbi:MULTISPECIES: ABC transporter ATP-binding protein [Acetobacterium]|jgi:ABC-2 type transport system ATP-binding protein|uniref:ABC-type transporter ATP-binding protein EcsA n=1 Tax=Acetobacterium wieringae TaxID=52694 RepID=A0A1F2PDF6_9FIRM|nr:MULTISPECIES: ABC transporter ATP-binding protein [Acetobacterium]OFV69298.1 ABC-type transporter ATP-binding protein EcsA [Acetobacterium wieringae]
MLILEHISKTYGNKNEKAVDDVSFEVHPGEIFGFVGPNGAGKTTTIKMIVSLLAPNSGKIRINGIDNQTDILGAKKQFSYVPDNPELFEKIKGIEYLKFMADVYQVPASDRQERIERYLDIFEIKNAVNDPIGSFSHGMKQKLALVGALIHDPQVFILDEPMVGLDPKASFELKKIMREHCDRGRSVFFSTHVLDVAEKICDRIAIIKKGKLIEVGTMAEIREKAGSQESLENIFLELTE